MMRKREEMKRAMKIGVREIMVEPRVSIREREGQFCDKLDPSLYEWGSGALAVHVLQGLYVLAEKTSKLAEKTKRMIEFLEARGR